jgi:hypothetical protein
MPSAGLPKSIPLRVRIVRPEARFLSLAAGLAIVAGQAFYLPERLSTLRETWRFANARNQTERLRLAYTPADYDLLRWVDEETPRDSVILLVTPDFEPRGTPGYVLYHRALYLLYPRRVWWVSPARHKTHPEWWITAEPEQETLRRLAKERRARIVLACGFSAPPVSGRALTFDSTTHLVFLDPLR